MKEKKLTPYFERLVEIDQHEQDGWHPTPWVGNFVMLSALACVWIVEWLDPWWLA